MNRFLLALLLIAPAVSTAQDNPNYDPDFNGDGCYSVADILGLLPLFGFCAPQPFQCGDSIQFDNYWYGTVPIGNQCWFAENLRTTAYADGTAIPEVTENSTWFELSTGARCNYNNDEANVVTNGRLYNWHAVDDARGVCPSSWHVPTDGEWTDLKDYITSLGFIGEEGAALKATTGWPDNGNGTDDFGFSALPGGGRIYDVNSGFGNAIWGYWWSSSLYGDTAWARIIYDYSPNLLSSGSNPQKGYSVRCLMDADALGCTDPAYLEYNPVATVEDGSCTTMVMMGCTHSDAVNYDPCANTDDGSCCLSPTFDGYTYDVVEIGDQCWFAENLRTTTYANGDSIPAGLTDGEWTSTTSGASAVFGEGGSNCNDYSPDIDACNEVQSLAEYGRMYNWYAVDDARGMCPAGWHVPTDGEWTQLQDCIISQGFAGMAGTALKSTTGWYNNGNGTDDLGFSALPGGHRVTDDGHYSFAGARGYWWSSSPNGGYAWRRVLADFSPDIDRWEANPQNGFSVRCLRDAE